MDVLRFKLDEEWYDLPEGMNAFGALRSWIISKLADDSRVLLGVLSGDVSLTLNEMVEWEGRPINEFETLEFLSAEPAALASRTCEDLIIFMDVLEEQGEELKANLMAGDGDRAATNFKECVEGWDIALQGFRNLIRMDEIDASIVEIGGQPLPVVAAKLRGVILKMVENYTRGDMDSMKLLLSGELALYIPSMREAFEKILEKLEEVVV